MSLFQYLCNSRSLALHGALALSSVVLLAIFLVAFSGGAPPAASRASASGSLFRGEDVVCSRQTIIDGFAALSTCSSRFAQSSTGIVVNTADAAATTGAITHYELHWRIPAGNALWESSLIQSLVAPHKFVAHWCASWIRVSISVAVVGLCSVSLAYA